MSLVRARRAPAAIACTAALLGVASIAPAAQAASTSPKASTKVDLDVAGLFKILDPVIDGKPKKSVNGLADGMKKFDKKVDNLGAKYKATYGKVKKLENGLTSEIKVLSPKLASHEHEINSVKLTNDQQSAFLNNVNSSLAALSSNFDATKRQVLTIESQITGLTNATQALDNRVGEIEGRLAETPSFVKFIVADNETREFAPGISFASSPEGPGITVAPQSHVRPSIVAWTVFTDNSAVSVAQGESQTLALGLGHQSISVANGQVNNLTILVSPAGATATEFLVKSELTGVTAAAEEPAE